jgi:hypothetical protein
MICCLILVSFAYNFLFKSNKNSIRDVFYTKKSQLLNIQLLQCFLKVQFKNYKAKFSQMAIKLPDSTLYDKNIHIKSISPK